MPKPTCQRFPNATCLLLIGLTLLPIFSSNFVFASQLRETPIVKAVKNAAPSIVNIHGHKTVDTPNEDGEYEGPRRVNGMGTGVVIDERGYIITNHHVIDGVRRIQVTLSDGRTYTAKLIAHDPQTDLAVIRINAGDKLPIIRIGRSDDLMAGEPVIAVGNAYGYHDTVTRGIISALNRTVEVTDSQKYYDLIQTDASINPGNSGGPLLNIDGNMIGINVAVRVGAQGIGFAIPVDKAMKVAANLLKAERVAGTWHGIHGDSIIRAGQRMFLVNSVADASPAATAGVRAGDVISKIANIDVERQLDLERALLGKPAGAKFDLQVERDTTPKTMNLQIAQAPGRNRPVATTTPIVRRSGGQRVADQVWQVLGIRVSPVGGSVESRGNTKYNGGLRITSVRGGGAADRNGIQPGDVLVGMHIWETISLDNLDYIMNKADLEDPNNVKFFVVRGDKTRVGELPVTRR